MEDNQVSSGMNKINSPEYIEVKGGALFYERKGSGEPIVFIHGNYNDHLIWEEQMERFSTGYDVISYDLRGYGHSDTPRTPFSNVKDLKMLLDTLGLTKVTLVGSSMGGSVAVDFTLAYPGDVGPPHYGSAFCQRPQLSSEDAMAGDQTAYSGQAEGC